jgi:hypothetical protein
MREGEPMTIRITIPGGDAVALTEILGTDLDLYDIPWREWPEHVQDGHDALYDALESTARGDGVVHDLDDTVKDDFALLMTRIIAGYTDCGLPYAEYTEWSDHERAAAQRLLDQLT